MLYMHSDGGISILQSSRYVNHLCFQVYLDFPYRAYRKVKRGETERPDQVFPFRPLFPVFQCL